METLAQRALMLRESLGRSQAATDAVASILVSFDSRLSALDAAMRPIQLRTHAVRTAHENVDRTLRSAVIILTQFDRTREDVRATEIDKVDVYQSYRPGNIVRTLVIVNLKLFLPKLGLLISYYSSLGDARAYYLSTAKNKVGVVSAQSIAGDTLVPTSWTEMKCELTLQIEERKVAKVD